MIKEDHLTRSSNKYIALLISILALFLAISGGFGKFYQIQVVTKQVEVANVWGFFQAKSMKQHNLKIAQELLQNLGSESSSKVKQTIDNWTLEIARYESDFEKQEGKKELTDRADEYQKELRLYQRKYHYLEFVSAVLEIGIVMASASIIVSMNILAWTAAIIGVCSSALLGYVVTLM